MSTPLLSIITVVYNDVKHIKRTLLSVIEQSLFSKIEYILIDGASTDGTLEVIKNYQDKIAFLISEKDHGIYDAMNKGLQIATGKYVLFMNSGDEIFEKDTVEKLFNCASDADIYYGETKIIDEQGQVLGLRRHRTPERFTWKSFKYGMNISHQAIYIKRSLVDLYDLNYQLSADIDWILKAAKKAKKQKIVNTQLFVARFMIGGLSKQKRQQSLKERFQIFTHYYGLFPTLFNHAVIASRLLAYKIKNLR